MRNDAREPADRPDPDPKMVIAKGLHAEKVSRIACAAVLAGGAGRRMGVDKAGVRIGSETLLERAMRLARSVSRRLFVVGRSFEAQGSPDAPRIPDDYVEAGPLGGIATALRLAASQDCLILPCDMPLLSEDLLRRLIALHHDQPADCTLVVNPIRGRPEPLVGVYAPTCLAPMRESIAQRRLAIWRTLEPLRVQLLTVPRDEARQLVNLNTPKDLTELGG